MNERAADPRVAVIIPAKDEAKRIAATVRGVQRIPEVDLVVVVDDGSQDDTRVQARDAGAVVVRHPQNRGKASAMETGAAVAAMRDAEGLRPRLLLFVDADLGDSAYYAYPLIEPVGSGRADSAIAILPPQPGAGGHGFVKGLSRRAIASVSGWTPVQPLSGIRCLSRPAFEAALPLAHGWGVETAMSMDLLRAGFRIVEVPCDLHHRVSRNDLKGQLHRASQYKDVWIAVWARRLGMAGRRRHSRVRQQLPR